MTAREVIERCAEVLLWAEQRLEDVRVQLALEACQEWLIRDDLGLTDGGADVRRAAPGGQSEGAPR